MRSPTRQSDVVKIEVCYADTLGATRISIDLDDGATLGEAIAASRIIERLSLARELLSFGIFGKRAGVDARLRDGDRVEIYRPLIVDPMEARRRRVEKKRIGAVRAPAGKPL